jgi:predicted nuclease with TOPRIM domain
VSGQKTVTLIDGLRSDFEELKQTRRELLPRLRHYDQEGSELRERLESLWNRLRRRMRRLVPVADAKVSEDVKEAESLLAELRERYEELRELLEAPHRPAGGSRFSLRCSPHPTGRHPSPGGELEPRGHRRGRGGARWSS